MNEVEELCNRVAIIRAGRIVYEGRLDELRASAAGSYTLRTSDDAAAAQICASHPGIRELVVAPDGLRMRADEAAIEGLSARAGPLGDRAARPHPGRRLARGAVLRAHRGSRSTPAASPPELERVA